MHKVLLTKKYPKEKLQSAFGSNFQIENLDFIQAELIALGAIKTQIPSNATHFIVTSLRAAQHISSLYLSGTYYCVGEKSAQFLKNQGHKVALVALDAKALINQFKNYEKIEEPLVYFCSNLRKDTLPNGLKDLGFNLKEIITYQIVSKEVKINHDFDAIAFFSPSGVKSFKQQYDIPKKAIIFALGNTTANEVGLILNQQAIIPKEPNFESLTQTIKAHLDAKK